MLPIMLLCIAFLAFLWSFTIKEPSYCTNFTEATEPLWPILKRPVVAEFFYYWIFSVHFRMHLFIVFIAITLSQAGFSQANIGFLWSVGVIAEIIMFAYANVFFNRYSWRTLVLQLFRSNRYAMVDCRLISEWCLSRNLLAQTIHAFSFGLFHYNRYANHFSKFHRKSTRAWASAIQYHVGFRCCV